MRAWVCSTLLLTGCLGGEATAPADPREQPGSGEGMHHPNPPGEELGAPPGSERLSLAQVALSFQTILGQPWTVSDGAGERVSVDGFAYALGYPDYYGRVAEDREPHLLYAKFLHEGALAACGDALEADRSRPRAERVLLRQAELADRLPEGRARIVENLRDLKLRFHGARLAAGDPGLEPYLELFAAVNGLAGSAPGDGWRAVCVALIDDPEFSFR